MQVMLLDRITKLGKLGELSESEWHARNFLIPKGLAKRATQKQRTLIDKEELEQKALDKLKKAKDLGLGFGIVVEIVPKGEL